MIQTGNIILDQNPRKIEQNNNVLLEITGTATLAIIGYPPSQLRLNVTYSTENNEDLLEVSFNDDNLLDNLLSGIGDSYNGSSVNNIEDRQKTVTDIETKAKSDITRNNKYKEQLKSIIDNNLE